MAEIATYLYAPGNVGISFHPTDIADPAQAADGETIDFARYLYAPGNVGVGFYPTDIADPAQAADGRTDSFDRFLYAPAGDINATTPTPHIWYVYPVAGEVGDEYAIIGYGFGDTQPTYAGTVTLNGLPSGIVSWEMIAESDPNLEIDPALNIAEPIHQRIRATVPDGATSGLVIVCTDGP